ncbi:cadherin-like beta sandwich domain-containing protein [Pedobacter sp. ASV28]|uniref:cadherin-like beta sandwich domain-containing protein n=1 Tax=Pedobacter sp. ASV28 TaxID=2795123 RepID=UPI0018EBD2A3|nr:cadherin-like beta sandwich domain-containing protein [Pedobacter sp. ASV28]
MKKLLPLLVSLLLVELAFGQCPSPTISGNTIICPGSTTTLSTPAAGNNWVQKTDFGGVGRFYAAGFSIGSKGYIGTGDIGSGYTDDFWEYDSVTGAWTQKANFGGGARGLAIGFSIGNKGYMGTGYVGSYKNDFWEYDPSANIWTKKADFGGTGRMQAVGFSINNMGYIGTGYDNVGYRNDFWEYNPTSNTWNRKADVGGSGRSGAIGFNIGTKGYIGTGYGGAEKNDFWEYDPSNNSWTQKANAGTSGRYTAVGFSIGSKGYIGSGYRSVYPTYPNDLLEYDPPTNTWTTKANLGGIPRAAAIGFSIGGKGYIGTGGNSTNDDKGLWEYTPSYTYQWSPSGQTTSSITAVTAGSYTVTITDGAGCSAVSATTTVKENTAPTNITLTENTVAENLAIGTVVGNLSTTYIDVGQTFTYTLAVGAGDTGNAQFTIVGNQLKTNVVFDYESHNSYSVRIKTTDNCGSYEKVFIINITDVNEPIILDNVGLTSTTSAVAYSLRKLSSAYAGPAIKVRQTTHHAEANVAFDNNNGISEESIVTITAAGSSGFTVGQTMRFANFYNTQSASVVTWYDQSGWQRNMGQATANLQPSIVTSGAINKLKNKPVLYFGTANLSVPAELIFTAGVSMVAVAQGNTTTPSSLITKTNVNQPAPFDYTNNVGDFYTGNGSSSNSATNLAAAAIRSDVSVSVPESVYSFTMPTGGTYTNYLNGLATASGTINGFLDKGTKLMMGNRNDNGGSGNFYVPEIILFNSVLSNIDRNIVENNQKTHFISVSADADLANLTLSNATITSFAASTTSYAVHVSNAITSTTITPSLADLNAIIKVSVNGGARTSVTSGYASGELPLNVGSNSIEVLVTAQDNTTTKLYTVTIVRLEAQPILQAKNVIVSDIAASTASINWANGNGTARAVFITAAATGLPTLVDGTSYTANATFGSGTAAGAGWYCIYNGTGTTVNVNGLNALTNYRVMVAEYNGNTTNVAYLSTAATNNPLNFTTLPNTLEAITRASTNPTNAASIQFTVTFGAVVSGLTASNFTLSTTGVGSPSITSVIAATGHTWTVTVNTGSGSGSIKLLLDNATGITPGISTTLPYINGETYTIDKTITITPASLRAASVGTYYSQQLTATGGTSYTFSTATGTLPNGLTLTTDGLLSGTPSTNGDISFTVTATDISGESGQKSYTLSINSVLPVGFISFKAKLEGNRSKLEWATLSEINNDRFEIERSIDGKLFSLLATVKGNGTTTVAHHYLTYDNSPANGINYYRLKQYDDNNRSTILDDKIVNFKLLNAVAVKLYPNPTSEELNLIIGNDQDIEVKVTLSDVIGRVWHTEIIKLVAGTHNYKLNLKNKLMPGQYIVGVMGAGLKKSLKLIVN